MGDKGPKGPIGFGIGPKDKITETEKKLQRILTMISAETVEGIPTTRALLVDELILGYINNGILDIKDLYRIFYIVYASNLDNKNIENSNTKLINDLNRCDNYV